MFLLILFLCIITVNFINFQRALAWIVQSPAVLNQYLYARPVVVYRSYIHTGVYMNFCQDEAVIFREFAAILNVFKSHI